MTLLAGVLVSAVALAPVATVRHTVIEAGMPPVEVAVDAAIDEGPQIANWVRQAMRTVAVDLPDGAGDDLSGVQIEIGGAQYEYTFTVSATAREGVEPVPPQTHACSPCTNSELVEAVSAVVTRVITAQRTSTAPDPAATPSVSGTQTAPAGEHDGTTPLPSPTDRAKPIGGLGIAGIVSMVVGAGLVVGGAVEASKGLEANGGESSGRQKDHRPLGYGLVGAGGGLLVLGVAFLAADQTILKKRRQKRLASVRPVLTPTWAGISIGGRF